LLCVLFKCTSMIFRLPGFSVGLQKTRHTVKPRKHMLYTILSVTTFFVEWIRDVKTKKITIKT